MEIVTQGTKDGTNQSNYESILSYWVGNYFIKGHKIWTEFLTVALTEACRCQWIRAWKKNTTFCIYFY